MQENSEKTIYTQAIQAQFASVLSSDRFSRYLVWAGGDKEKAFQLYAINTQISEALYTPLQTLEITLRNRIHEIFLHHFTADWFDEPSIITTNYQRERVQKAKADLLANKKEVTPSAIVAKLMFGFWTTLLDKHHIHLWHACLHKIASKDGRYLDRKSLATPLTSIRILRNRIAHHESILHWNLPEHHARIIETTRYLSPFAAEWISEHSRFHAVYPQHDLLLTQQK